MSKIWAVNVDVYVDCDTADEALEAVFEMNDIFYSGKMSQFITGMEITDKGARWAFDEHLEPVE